MMLSSERAFDDFLTNLNPFIAQLAWEKFEKSAAQIRREQYDAETDALLQQLRVIDPRKRNILTPTETAVAIQAQWVGEIRYRESRRAS